MTERRVTIWLGLHDEIGDRLLEIRKQRDALLGQAVKIALKLDVQGQDRLRAAQDGLSRTRHITDEVSKSSQNALKDIGVLGSAITSRTIIPLAEYQKLWSSSLVIAKAFGAGALSALKGASSEFSKQKDLAQFWGTSGYIYRGIDSLSASLKNMLSGGGAGFTSWLQNGVKGLEQYRTGLVAASATLLAFGAMAAMQSKTTQNLITSTLDTRLMSRKLTDKKSAEEWIQQAQGEDWSAGRNSRLGVFQTILSKNIRIGQSEAQKRTEDIEKFWFANQEMLKKKGFGSAEALASAVSAPELVGDDATKFEDIFGLGFSKLLPQARLARLSTEAKGIDINDALSKRPDVIMTKRLEATTAAAGDAVLPVLNDILGGFLKISDAVGSIPGLGKMIGWGTVLTATAVGGLAVLSMLGGMITNLQVLGGVLKVGTAAHYAHVAAIWVANAAMGARAAITGSVAVATGLLTGQITLNTVVMTAWNTVMGAGAVAAGLFNAALLPEIILLGAVAAIIGIVAYKSGVLEAVLKGLSKINLGQVWKDLSKGDIGGAWKDLTKGFKLPSAKEAWKNLTGDLKWPEVKLPDVKGYLSSWKLPQFKLPDLPKFQLPKDALKVGLDILTAASPLGMSIKISLMIVDFLKKLWFNSNALNKAFGTGLSLWQKVLDFFNWLISLFRELQSWLGQAIPGAKKEGLRQDIQKTLGVTEQKPFGSKNITYENGKFILHLGDADNPRQMTSTRALSDEEAQALLGKGVVQKANLERQAPSFATGIADAVRLGLSGLTIKGLSELTDAINNLIAKMPNPVGAMSAATNAINTAGSTYVSRSTQAYNDAKARGASEGEAAYGSWDPGGFYKNLVFPSLDAGGPITGSGSLIGHTGEEMTPASAIRGGETTLAKINRMASSPSLGSGQSITVHVSNDVHIDKIEKDVDVDRLVSKMGGDLGDKLVFALRNRLDGTQLRGISYLRG